MFTRDQVIEAARWIAGCGWDDEGTPDEKCWRCAESPKLGSDGDYTTDERETLRRFCYFLETYAANTDEADMQEQLEKTVREILAEKAMDTGEE